VKHRNELLIFAFALAFLAALLPASPVVAVTMLFEVEATENDDNLSVNGVKIEPGDTLLYTVEWDTGAALTSGSNPTGNAHYETDSIQAGGSLTFNGTNIATNNSTASVDARAFEVKNDSGPSSEDKWKTESIFTDVAGPTVTVAGNSGTINVSSYTPEKIKIELKSTSLNFLSTNLLPLASADLTANLSDLVLASITDDKHRKFEMKWKGNIDGVKDPKIIGIITSLTEGPFVEVPEPSTALLILFPLAGLLLLNRRVPLLACLAVQSA